MQHKSTSIIITVVLVIIALFFLLLPGTALPPTQEHSTTRVDAPTNGATPQKSY